MRADGSTSPRAMLEAHGHLYEPTGDDVQWLARAVEAEGEPRALVAQTLVNGFMWARTALRSGRTLAQWVRAYAQPVNPRWFASGDLFQDAYARATSEVERAALARKARVREYGHSVRTSFADETYDAVRLALEHGPALPEATDYAAPSLLHAEPWRMLTSPTDGQNTFWQRPGALGWEGYRVVLSANPGGGPSGTLPLLALLVVGALLYGVARA